MPITDKQALLEADIRRALGRKHKRCRHHGDSRVVCLHCARVYCPPCEKVCPRCKAAPPQQQVVFAGRRSGKKSAAIYIPPPLPNEPRLRAVQTACLTFQILAIERHPESGEWMAVFPFKVGGYVQASDLGEQVYRSIRDHAVATPYGSGRLFKPDRWFVSFKLREVQS
jgi:hypothetical protein